MYDNDFDDPYPRQSFKEAKIIPLHSSQIQEKIRQENLIKEIRQSKERRVDNETISQELKRIREKFLGK